MTLEDVIVVAAILTLLGIASVAVATQEKLGGFVQLVSEGSMR